METTQSADGTTIAYDRTGDGPALVLVVGALCDRWTTKILTSMLADRFTVFEYDRRGRGDSGDTLPYSIEAEVQDLAAVLAAAGGSAQVYGHSSGGAIALEAAARGLPVLGVIAYEPPYAAADDRDEGPEQLRSVIADLLAAGRRAEAVETFIGTAAKIPEESRSMIRRNPGFPAMVALADTLVYDLALGHGGRPPLGRFSRITVPTLMVDGGDSDAWAARAADGVANAVPGARRCTVPGQGHPVAHQAIAPVIADFFAG